MTRFDDSVVAAVTQHMNDDHHDDNLLIVRAFGAPEATASTMIGLDGEAGVWRVQEPAGERNLRVAWPAGAVTERAEIRREAVALYRAACARLGVPPREEHAPETKPFSAVVRESSWGDHSSSEGATFMEDIMRGTGSRQDYVDLVAQHFFMYEALEAAAERVAAEPAFAGFHTDALVRLPAIAADLAHLIGGDWRERIEPVPATREYAARITEVAETGWVAGVVAHHYTRYLGDLSGGQMIAKRVAQQHGLGPDGIAFYDFGDLGSPTEFKQAYRAALDAFGARLSADEQARMLDEVRAAYRFNTDVFSDLGRRKQLAAV